MNHFAIFLFLLLPFSASATWLPQNGCKGIATSFEKQVGQYFVKFEDKENKEEFAAYLKTLRSNDPKFQKHCDVFFQSCGSAASPEHIKARNKAGFTFESFKEELYLDDKELNISFEELCGWE